MDGIALIEQAQEAGLKLSVVGDQLVMKGAKRLSPLVALIAQNKESVLAALMATSNAPPPIVSQLTTCVGVTETPSTQEKPEGFADSTLAKPKAGQNRQPIDSAPPPDEIVADPVILCPRCAACRVLPELRTMTGGLCYPCWLREGVA